MLSQLPLHLNILESCLGSTRVRTRLDYMLVIHIAIDVYYLVLVAVGICNIGTAACRLPRATTLCSGNGIGGWERRSIGFIVQSRLQQRR
jgi:hypothetical protein